MKAQQTILLWHQAPPAGELSLTVLLNSSGSYCLMPVSTLIEFKDPSWNLSHCTESAIIFPCTLLNTGIHRTDTCFKWQAKIIHEVMIYFILTVYSKKLWKLNSMAIDQWGDSRLIWKEGVKEDAAVHLWCHRWKLTAQNRTVWRQELWQAKSQLGVVLPWDG